jgi:hypothetical protein
MFSVTQPCDIRSCGSSHRNAGIAFLVKTDLTFHELLKISPADKPKAGRCLKLLR